MESATEAMWKAHKRPKTVTLYFEFSIDENSSYRWVVLLRGKGE